MQTQTQKFIDREELVNDFLKSSWFTIFTYDIGSRFNLISDIWAQHEIAIVVDKKFFLTEMCVYVWVYELVNLNDASS